MSAADPRASQSCQNPGRDSPASRRPRQILIRMSKWCRCPHPPAHERGDPSPEPPAAPKPGSSSTGSVLRNGTARSCRALGIAPGVLGWVPGSVQPLPHPVLSSPFQKINMCIFVQNPGLCPEPGALQELSQRGDTPKHTCNEQELRFPLACDPAAACSQRSIPRADLCLPPGAAAAPVCCACHRLCPADGLVLWGQQAPLPLGHAGMDVCVPHLAWVTPELGALNCHQQGPLSCSICPAQPPKLPAQLCRKGSETFPTLWI